MKGKRIPETVKQQADEIVARFNQTELKNTGIYYTTRYRGQFLYLDRSVYQTSNPICRLRYTGDISDWEFVIYQYSKEQYDPNSWPLYGGKYIDGTIEGAMKAGLETYPP